MNDALDTVGGIRHNDSCACEHPVVANALFSRKVMLVLEGVHLAGNEGTSPQPRPTHAMRNMA